MRISDWSSDVCSSDLFDQMEEPPAAVDKAFQQFFGIDSRLRAPLIKPGFRTRDLFRGRHPEQGQIIEAFEMRSEEHTSELQSLMRISYAVFCLKKKNKT